jgi:hypothetical protein
MSYAESARPLRYVAGSFEAYVAGLREVLSWLVGELEARAR